MTARFTSANAGRILIVEDEGDLREIVAYNLTKERFRVFTAANGKEAMEQLGRCRPDLILLDLMLPDADGYDLCRRIRQSAEQSDIPIIMVTARTEESDVLLGLGLGADDYVTKPFRVRELVARVKAVLRRHASKHDLEGSEVLRFDAITIDPLRHEVTVQGEVAHLTATEFRLLHFMAKRPGRAWSRDDLLRYVFEDDSLLGGRNVDVHIRAIRKKLGRLRDRIETVRGVGYRFRRES